MTAPGWAAVLLSLIRDEAIDLPRALSFNLALPALGTFTFARCFAEPLSQQFHGGIDEVVLQIGRFCH
jgi:hypothetical protein